MTSAWACCWPKTDLFSLGSLGERWIDLHWGFQLWAFGLWKLGGNGAILAGKCIVMVVALVFCLRPYLRGRVGFALLFLAAFGIYQTRLFLDARPLVLTILILSIQYFILVSHFQGRIARPWLILVPLQILLVNVQGLYPLGAVLFSSLAMGQVLENLRTKKNLKPQNVVVNKSLILTGIFMWMSGLINPYGLAGLTLPVSLLGRINPIAANIFSKEIAENEPFFQYAQSQPGHALPWILFILIVIYTFWVNSRRNRIGHGTVFFGFTLLGLMAIRNLPLVFFAGLISMGHNLNSALNSEMVPGVLKRDHLLVTFLARGGGYGCFLAVLLFYGPDVAHAWRYEIPGSLETPFRFPTGSADFLEKHPIDGTLFNELRGGGYLEFRLYPQKLAFVDGRMILRTAEFYRAFLEVVDHPEGFGRYREQYGLTHAVLPISEDKRFLPLAAFILGHERWDLLQCDGASVLLVKKGSLPDLALPMDSSSSIISVKLQIHDRFGKNIRLEKIALRNMSEFLNASGYTLAADEFLKQSDNVRVQALGNQLALSSFDLYRPQY